MSTILITGVGGFLGRNCADYFSSKGNMVYGIGHGASLVSKQLKNTNIIKMKDDDVSLKNLNELNCIPNYILHCAGSGSVGYSLTNPYDDFKKNVDSLFCVFEYIRQNKSQIKLVYPSSPAVIGDNGDLPIKEDAKRNPISPYGYHKKIAELLCESHSNFFDVNITVIRFFSIYGEGLRKQLLWDTCKKIALSNHTAVFSGNGDEIRDWIYIQDAVSLIDRIIQLSGEGFSVFNGGTGIQTKVSQIVGLLRNYLKPEVQIQFDGKTRTGNPTNYLADVTKLKSIGWWPSIDLEKGVKQYATWFKGLGSD